MTRLELATFGSTDQCSTLELQSPLRTDKVIGHRTDKVGLAMSAHGCQSAPIKEKVLP